MSGLLLSARRSLPEKMDADGLSPGLHRQALEGLRRINCLSRAATAIWRPITALCRDENPGQLTLLDVATGGGDVPVALALRAAQRRISLQVSAVDRSATAIEHARQAAGELGVDLRLQQVDVLRDPLPGSYDIVTCSLFLHHLSAEECVTVLRKMRAAARRMVIVNDLRRSGAGWLAAWIGCRVLSRSPIVHYDGPVSVAAAWSPQELLSLARSAGLEPALIRKIWPWRMLLTCRSGGRDAP